MSWFGNKRSEINDIMNNIHLSNNIKYICEPYCGTSSLSYYISTLYPNKYKYMLNDNDPMLIQLYTIAQNADGLQKLQDELNELIKDINKDKYKEIIKDAETSLTSYIIKRKIYNIRHGMYPNDARRVPKTIDLINCPVVNFLRTEDITLTCEDGLEFYKKYCNNKDMLIFMDPPYLNVSNDMYSDKKNTNIYEYLFYNSIKKSKAYIILCLENNWIIKLLFKSYNIHTYDKEYNVTKRKTIHMIVTNKCVKVDHNPL
jgi:site-specific DNA-adenine methylase